MRLSAKSIQLLTIFGSLAVYAASFYLPPDAQPFVQQTCMLLIGGQVMRRAGDLEPIKGGL